jgi:VWFA-related protein
MLQANRVLLLAWLIAAPAFAQDEQAIFRSDTRLVVLHASVVDRSGKQIVNLPKEAFKVYENNVEQPIKLFRREDIPVSMGIVIDNSGSMRDKRQKVEAAAVRLVKGSNKNDEVFIVNFNDDAFLDVPFTNSIEKLEEGVARIDSRGGTAMRDAVSMSLDYLKAEGKKDKKVLLVVTDGNDTTSTGITLEKLVEKAHRSEVLIYAIGILSEEEKRDAKRAKRALDALTKASGGASFYPEQLADVENLADAIAHDIRNQYVIAYTPTNQTLDGSFRTIKVTAGRYQVRTRTGYYATPEPAKPKSVSQAQ